MHQIESWDTWGDNHHQSVHTNNTEDSSRGERVIGNKSPWSTAVRMNRWSARDRAYQRWSTALVLEQLVFRTERKGRRDFKRLQHAVVPFVLQYPLLQFVLLYQISWKHYMKVSQRAKYPCSLIRLKEKASPFYCLWTGQSLLSQTKALDLGQSIDIQARGSII